MTSRSRSRTLPDRRALWSLSWRPGATAPIAAATSPPWRVPTLCTSPSLACLSLAAPTLLLLAKVGWSRPPTSPPPLLGPPMGWLVGGSHSSPPHPGTRGLCFHCRGELSFLPHWGPSSAPLALSISLSLHAFTFGRTCSSCLESCCSLLCPQGQRYLDLSSFGRGGLGGAGQVGGGCHILVWATGPGVRVPFISFWHVPPYLLGSILRVPTLILMAQPCGEKQGRGRPVPAPEAS